jgi:hypothetical protein
MSATTTQALYRAGGASSTASTSTAPAALKLADIEAMVQKIQGLPPAKWMLVAPDGRVWSDEDPMKLAQTIALMRYGL